MPQHLRLVQATQIKLLREQKNFSQAKLAACLGLTQQQISDIETARYDCSLQRFLAICRALDYAVEVRCLDQEGPANAA